jgi:hypothetical protein
MKKPLKLCQFEDDKRCTLAGRCEFQVTNEDPTTYWYMCGIEEAAVKDAENYDSGEVDDEILV